MLNLSCNLTKRCRIESFVLRLAVYDDLLSTIDFSKVLI